MGPILACAELPDHFDAIGFRHLAGRPQITGSSSNTRWWPHQHETLQAINGLTETIFSRELDALDAVSIKFIKSSFFRTNKQKEMRYSITESSFKGKTLSVEN